MHRLFYTIATLCLTVGSISAQPRIDKDLRIELNRENGLYSVSDTVKVCVTPLKEYDKPLEIDVFENGTHVKTIKLGVIDSKKTVFTDVRTEPVAVMLEFRQEGTLPKKIPMNLDQTEDTFRIGYVVEGSGFKPGFKTPPDLKSYWARQIRRLRNHKMEAVAKPVALSAENAGLYECFDVKINSLDTIPVRGYVARPKDAAERSLPIVIQLHAAGVSGNWCRAKVNDAVRLASYGAIAFDFNAHGMLNDADESYYKELENGRLKGYSERPITNRKNYYFRMMILRAIRALDYITQDPAWDGKTIMLLGESQGGAQAVAMAGLDDRVTDVVINVPAMIGNGGFLLGRNDAWPFPAEINGLRTPTAAHVDLPSINETQKSRRDMLKVAPYFDGALLLKGCKARFLVEIGLVDTACPPSEVFSGINGIEGPVQVICSPYRNHWSSRIPAQYMPWWNENVEKYRQNYIKQRLAGDSTKLSKEQVLSHVDELKRLVDEKIWPTYNDPAYSMEMNYYEEGPFRMHLVQAGANTEARMECSSPEITMQAVPSVKTYEEWYAMLMHECFHGFQYKHKDFWDKMIASTPEDFITSDSLKALKQNYDWYRDMLSKENALLKKAYDASDIHEIRHILTDFYSIRHERLRAVKDRLGLDLIEYYPLIETMEGSARYIEYRLAREQGITDTDWMTNLDSNSYYYASGLYLMLIMDKFHVPYKEKLFLKYNTLAELIQDNI